MTGPEDDDLHVLRSALHAPGTPQELTGQDQVLAAYRAAMRPGRAPGAGLRLAWGVGLSAAVASVTLSMTAVTAAAYTGNLPHGVQHAAHQLFHRIGVPESDHYRHAGSPDQDDPPALGIRPVSYLVEVGAPLPVRLELLAQRADAASWDATLEMRTPGTEAWERVGRSALDADGVAEVTVPRVPHNLQLRWSLARPGRHPVYSGIALVRARPPLTVAFHRSSGHSTPSASLAVATDPGESGELVTIEEQVPGGWQDLGTAQVDPLGKAQLALGALQAGRHVYRASLRPDRLFAGTTERVTVDVPHAS